MLNSIFGTVRQAAGDTAYWEKPERCGWLMKQGEYIKTWRRRWFVLKDGKIFWFKFDRVTRDSEPRGVIDVGKCLSVKGAEETINKPHSFEIAMPGGSQFFIADEEKDKEDWINAVGRAIVRHSRSLLDHDVQDYQS
ncbi:unnamed protein product [Pedinophyceae sp. YPF-701]|nr:unnamed protein product [Pedinophyceae sp. YPF-701]